MTTMDYEDDDTDMMTNRPPPQQPTLVRYEVANNIFEVLDNYKLQYAIGQGAYGIVWYKKLYCV